MLEKKEAAAAEKEDREPRPITDDDIDFENGERTYVGSLRHLLLTQDCSINTAMEEGMLTEDGTGERDYGAMTSTWDSPYEAVYDELLGGIDRVSAGVADQAASSLFMHGGDSMEAHIPFEQLCNNHLQIMVDAPAEPNEHNAQEEAEYVSAQQEYLQNHRNQIVVTAEPAVVALGEGSVADALNDLNAAERAKDMQAYRERKKKEAAKGDKPKKKTPPSTAKRSKNDRRGSRFASGNNVKKRCRSKSKDKLELENEDSMMTVDSDCGSTRNDLPLLENWENANMDAGAGSGAGGGSAGMLSASNSPENISKAEKRKAELSADERNVEEDDFTETPVQAAAQKKMRRIPTPEPSAFAILEHTDAMDSWGFNTENAAIAADSFHPANLVIPKPSSAVKKGKQAAAASAQPDDPQTSGSTSSTESSRRRKRARR